MLTFDVAFAGTAEEQKLASAIFDVMRGHGRFMASDQPIKVGINSLAEFLSGEKAGVDENKIRKVVAANSLVFAIDDREEDEEPLVVTTRLGRVSIPQVDDTRHTFAKRFMTPLPKPELPVQPPRERPRVKDGWGDISTLIEASDLEPYDMGPVPASVLDARDVEMIEVAAPIESLTIVEPEVVEEPLPSRIVKVPAAPAAAELTDVDDVVLANAIGERLRPDPRVANFGDQ